MEACFSIEKYARNQSYKTAWLKVIKAVATKYNMLHKIKFYICFDVDNTIQIKLKEGDEFVDIECIETHVNIITEEYKK